MLGRPELVRGRPWPRGPAAGRGAGPLMKMGYIYKYYDKLTPNNYEEAMFDESKMRYRVRYALSQKGRILVQRYYRKLEGEEQISVPS